MNVRIARFRINVEPEIHGHHTSNPI
jgi:hypothetical protein